MAAHRSASALALAAFAAASPFDPHPPAHQGPWFEGWFTRVTDVTSKQSWAVITGSFQPKGVADYNSTWVAAIVAKRDGTVLTEQVFPEQNSVRITKDGAAVTREAAKEEAAEFEWTSTLGKLTVSREGTSSLDLRFPSGLALNASLSERVPWDPKCESCGPEGWAGKLPGGLLPTHYYVQTLASKAEYTLNGVAGRGFAHQETNYGAFFPTAWIWFQGVSADGKTQILLSGGEFTVAGATVKQFIVGYRSPSRSWDFRGIDLDPVTSEADGCQGTLKITAQALGRRLVLHASAPVNTFSDPLYFPTSTGWSNKPGCVESYFANTDISIYEGVLPHSPVETVHIEQVALEFGGAYRCKEAGQAPRPLGVSKETSPDAIVV